MHVDAGSVEHSSSGSSPATMGPHTPSLPWPFFAVVHGSQTAPQSASQQTPSAQNPLTQSAASAQLCPSAWSGSQTPPSQWSAVAQFALLAHGAQTRLSQYPL